MSGHPSIPPSQVPDPSGPVPAPVPGGSTSPPGAAGPLAGWKTLLALISLAFSVLLWFNGLVDSLSRPSVVDALSLRQLELSALAAAAVPEALQPTLLGKDPRANLADELERQMQGSTLPAPAVQRLELALLLRGRAPEASAGQLRELREMIDTPRRPLLDALIAGERPLPEQQRQLLAAWKAPTMLQQLSCEQLGGPESACPAARSGSRLLLQLLGVSLVPGVLLLGGLILLLREGWLTWRGRLAPAAQLLGPPLDVVDVTLLISGGFVLMGEVLTPQLLQGGLTAVVGGLALSEALSQGVQVIVLYLGLMTAPLLMLWRLLAASHSIPPPGGWLQWHWHPPGTALLQAVRTLLMVLPVVALSGWLIDTVWKDPGGSNPLLELVLTSADSRALACLAFTAIVLAPLFEETLFRGVLLPVIGQRWGPGRGVLVSAAIFALAHLSLGELVPLFLLGLGLGWLRWRTGRLAAPVLMHGLWNGLTFLNLLLLAN